MSNYTCHMVTAFILILIVFSLQFAGWISQGWLIFVSGHEWSFGLWDGCTAGNNYLYWGTNTQGYGCNYGNSETDMRGAAFWILLAAICITSFDAIFIFSYLCGLCCCGVRPWMITMTKVHMAFCTIGAILTLTTCTLFLVDIYAVNGLPITVTTGGITSTGNLDAIDADAIPGWSFYLTLVAGILLWIGGCVGFSARKAAKIGVENNPEMGNSVTMAYTGYHTSMMQNPAMFMTPGSTSAGPSMTGQLPPVPMTPAPFSYRPERIILMSTSTQTSLPDVRE